METFSVYGLFDHAEPEVIRYVGQCRSIEKRIRRHYMDMAVYYGPQAAWKWSVLFFGRRFGIRSLESVSGTRDDSLSRERWHIADQQAQHGRLVNATPYWHRQKELGVGILTARAYIDAISALREIVAMPHSERAVLAMRRIAHVADALQKAHPSLALCGRFDDFYHVLPTLKKSSELALDAHAVSL